MFKSKWFQGQGEPSAPEEVDENIVAADASVVPQEPVVQIEMQNSAGEEHDGPMPADQREEDEAIVV